MSREYVVIGRPLFDPRYALTAANYSQRMQVERGIEVACNVLIRSYNVKL